MDFLDKNLAVISMQEPGLAARIKAASVQPEAMVQITRKGQPGLIVGQNRLTSSVDPVNEGLSLAGRLPAGPVVALGFGLGYHLEPLTGKRQLIVWEPDIALLRLSLSVRDCSSWLGQCKLVVDKADLGDLNGFQIFAPKAMERLYAHHMSTLQRMIRQQDDNRKPRPEQPRVLVIPPLLGGTLEPSYWCREALQSLGCQTRLVPVENVAPLYRRLRSNPLGAERQARVQAPLMRFLGELAVLEAEEFAPDLVLALAQAPLDRRAISELKSLGCKVAFWFVEDFRQMRYFAEVASTYDYFFYIQGQEIVERLEHLGANHSFLPVAAHPPVHRPLGLSPEQQASTGAPIGFMGAGYPNRIRVLNHLVEKGLPLKIWGSDWPVNAPLSAALHEDRYITSREIVEIYNSCPIVLNLHSSPASNAPIGGVDFINPRTFEVPACNAFQLVDKVECLHQFFEPDVDVATYSSEAELAEKADYYLRHPGLRQSMTDRARKKVLAHHTYYHRMETMLDKCLGPMPVNLASAPAEPVTWLINHAG